MKKLIIIILLAISSAAFSQDWPLQKMVTDKKVPFVRIPGFSLSGNKQLPRIGTFQELTLSPLLTKQLLEERPQAIHLSIPLSTTETINCELIKFDLGTIKYTQNNDDVIENVKIPVTYRGIVTGELKKNNVILTVNEDYMALIATLSDKTIQVTKSDDQDKTMYRLYNSEKIQFPVTAFACGTIDKPLSQVEIARQSKGVQARPAADDKCVNVFVDCFDSLFQWRNNSYQQTINYVYELFNAVAAGYTNEQINIQLLGINVWTTPDPYRGDTRENALADLAANYKDNFWGNICVGLDYSTNGPRSGLASSIGRAKGMSPGTCPAYTAEDNPFCYNDLNYTSIGTVKNFPTGPNATGSAIYLVMHEMGHLLGARHTKWCGWKLSSNPDTFGALDSCGGMEALNNTTSICPPGPPPPATGATIMSYCVSNNAASDFVNFNNGFGTLPGNAIRDFVNQNACIPGCLACVVQLNFRDISIESFYSGSPRSPLKNQSKQEMYAYLSPFYTQKILHTEYSKGSGVPKTINTSLLEIAPSNNIAKLKRNTIFK